MPMNTLWLQKVVENVEEVLLSNINQCAIYHFHERYEWSNSYGHVKSSAMSAERRSEIAEDLKSDITDALPIPVTNLCISWDVRFDKIVIKFDADLEKDKEPLLRLRDNLRKKNSKEVHLGSGCYLTLGTVLLLPEFFSLLGWWMSGNAFFGTLSLIFAIPAAVGIIACALSFYRS